MQYYLYLLGELIALFLLSHFLTQSLSLFFYTVTRNKKFTVYLLAFLFFPGTLIHELAHYFMAVLLQVPAGEMKLMPVIEGKSIKLGSVMIARTDPFRRMLIGVAPFLIGTGILFGILYLLSTSFQTLSPWVLGISFYIIFQVANTMFSSKKDLEGTIELLAVVIIFLGLFFLLGGRIHSYIFDFLREKTVIQNIQTIVFYLLLPITINICIILFLRLILRSFRKFT